MSTDFRALCAELLGALENEGHAHWPGGPDGDPLIEQARAALAEFGAIDHKVASEDTVRRIRSTTKRWRVSVIITTNDSAIDTRIGCGIWKTLDTEREILESVSLPEYLPAIKETTND